MKLPQTISFQVKDNADKPFSTADAMRQIQRQFKGVVSADGKWLQPAGADWKVELIEYGLEPGSVYRVTHNHGYPLYSVNYNTLDGKGNMNILNMNEYITVFKITDAEGKLVQNSFAFCMSVTTQLR